MKYEESIAYTKRVEDLMDFCKYLDISCLPVYNLMLLEEKMSEAPYRKSSIMYRDLIRILEEFRKMYKGSESS